VLRPLGGIFTPSDYPDLLVGLASPDDAAVWRLDAERALVVTTDFFTPVVDTPYEYGAIAAANSLSDVYAMGGTPFLALNIAAMPASLDPAIVGEILRGGAEKAREAGVVIAGGHTVQDEEPKYGLVALGFVHPEKKLTKSGARPGDALVLTKPLGFGVTTTAIKRGIAAQTDIDEAVGWMSRLNRTAAEAAREVELTGGTDVTGYSLLGHGYEMAAASGVGLRIDFARVPFITCARKYAEQGAFPGGSFDNAAYFGPHVEFDPALNEVDRMLLFDAQTSGGLLLAVPRERSSRFNGFMEAAGGTFWEIGEVVDDRGIRVGS
jgi:selenide,water dikinase